MNETAHSHLGDLMSVTQVARKLGVSRVRLLRIRRLANQAGTPIGNAVVYLPSEVEVLEKELLKLYPSHDPARPLKKGRPPLSRTG